MLETGHDPEATTVSLETLIAERTALRERVHELEKNVAMNAFADALKMSMLAMAVNAADSSIKNYQEMNFTWDPELIPQAAFQRASITFYRKDGKSPHELREDAEHEVAELKERLAETQTWLDKFQGCAAQAEMDLLREREAAAHPDNNAKIAMVARRWVELFERSSDSISGAADAVRELGLLRKLVNASKENARG